MAEKSILKYVLFDIMAMIVVKSGYVKINVLERYRNNACRRASMFYNRRILRSCLLFSCLLFFSLNIVPNIPNIKHLPMLAN